jgi:hypothetical protein
MFRDLKQDRSGILMNMGIGYILGAFLIGFTSILFVFHSKNWLMDVFGGFWAWAPVIFGLGITLIGTTLNKDVRFLLILFGVATVGYWLVQVM